MKYEDREHDRRLVELAVEIARLPESQRVAVIDILLITLDAVAGRAARAARAALEVVKGGCPDEPRR